MHDEPEFPKRDAFGLRESAFQDESFRDWFPFICRERLLVSLSNEGNVELVKPSLGIKSIYSSVCFQFWEGEFSEFAFWWIFMLGFSSPFIPSSQKIENLGQGYGKSFNISPKWILRLHGWLYIHKFQVHWTRKCCTKILICFPRKTRLMQTSFYYYKFQIRISSSNWELLMKWSLKQFLIYIY